MDQQTLIDKANQTLTDLYGPKHAKPINWQDVDAVYARNVLSVQADAKTKKGSSQGYLTGILYFAPAKLSGIEVCPARSKGCTAACLFSAGRGRFYSVTRARIVKTLAFHLDRQRFVDTIKKSIASLKTKAKNKNMIPVVRLNGTSDLPWDRFTDIIQTFSDVQFYDYTKIKSRIKDVLPSNYQLTFSLSEENLETAKLALQNKINVAAVFFEVPKTYQGKPVIDGDKTDLRFLDEQGGFVVGLKAKGLAKKDKSGFVI